MPRIRIESGWDTGRAIDETTVGRFAAAGADDPSYRAWWDERWPTVVRFQLELDAEDYSAASLAARPRIAEIAATAGVDGSMHSLFTVPAFSA